LKAKAQAPVKKPYQKPKLRVYGNIRDLTKGLGMAGTSDKGTGQPKTH
jgi:hypothetical protein